MTSGWYGARVLVLLATLVGSAAAEPATSGADTTPSVSTTQEPASNSEAAASNTAASNTPDSDKAASTEAASNTAASDTAEVPTEAVDSKKNESGSTASSGQSSLDVCLENHVAAQSLRREVKLLESRAALLRCAAADCPKAVRADCVQWNQELAQRIPSLTFQVTVEGEFTRDVRVFISGKRVLEQLDGRALELDPGVHELRFEMDGYPPQTRSVLLSEGEQLRQIKVEFHSPSPANGASPTPGAPPHKQESSISTLTYILGGVGIAAGIGAATMTVSTLNLESEMETGCSPRCSNETVNVLRGRALIADITTGASVLFLAGAVVSYWRDTQRAPSSPELDVAVLPGRGVMGTVRLYGM